MGGLHLRTLPTWADCERCDRCEHRVAVVAPTWPTRVKVVVFDRVAPIASQVTGLPSPPITRLVEQVRQRLGLDEQECISDTLLACGVGRTASAADVAACSGRFLDQEDFGARPAVVAFADRAAANAAWEAGLVTHPGPRWSPVGLTYAPRIVLLDNLERGLREIARALKCSPKAPLAENRGKLAELAADLHGVLGQHLGARVLEHGATRTLPRMKLQVDWVKGHLLGHGFVSPFHPQGPWSYVVLDIDRHNAMQEERFEHTVAGIRRRFQRSRFIQSSASGGVHVYVRLPPGWEYSHAALVVRAYVTLESLRWVRVTRGNKTISAELVEVPSEPTRLPFGVGSSILGSNLSLDQQLRRFLQFLRDAAPDASADFERACAKVFRHFKIRELTPAGRRKIERWLLDQEVAHLPDPTPSPTDPWSALAQRVGGNVRGPKLSPAVWKVAMNGVPAYGSRIRWTQRLLKELRDLVGPEEAEALLLAWLRDRAHVSADIETELEAVELQVRRAVADEYKKVGGVPVRVWKLIRDRLHLVRQGLYQPIPGHTPPTSLERQKKLKMDDVLATAFFIARGFFQGKTIQRPISWREFARYVGKNKSSAMRAFLLDGYAWLTKVREAERGKSSAIYALTYSNPPRWPARPREPRLFVPPP